MELLTGDSARAASALRVDIVVDSYNYRRFVADAVESALAQTHRHVHVIVVDDGSTDGSQELLRAYDDRVELVLKTNGGQASALNAGAARSDGDILMFLDADDILRPNAAALVATAFAANPRAAKVQYRMEMIDESGAPTGIVKPYGHLPVPAGDVRRAELTFPFDLVWLPNGASAFRRDILRRILPIPEQRFAECPDWYLVHLSALLGEVVSLRDIGACYRLHDGNRYERGPRVFDLGHVRKAVVFSAATKEALEQLAGEIGLRRPYARILSVADIANRLVSLKLEPAHHPIPTDRVGRLARDGVSASLRRFDVAWPMKLLYIGWFVTTAVAPRRLAQALARLLLPERRQALNPILRLFHRWNHASAATAKTGSGAA